MQPWRKPWVKIGKRVSPEGRKISSHGLSSAAPQASRNYNGLSRYGMLAQRIIQPKIQSPPHPEVKAPRERSLDPAAYARSPKSQSEATCPHCEQTQTQPEQESLSHAQRGP